MNGEIVIRPNLCVPMFRCGYDIKGYPESFGEGLKSTCVYELTDVGTCKYRKEGMCKSSVANVNKMYVMLKSILGDDFEKDMGK